MIALDIATKTGFATWTKDSAGCPLAIGTWELTKASERQGQALALRRFDPRVRALRSRVAQTVAALPKPVLVVFEDVEFSSYTKQTQLWSSLRAAVWLAPDVDLFDCVPVGTLKLFATGHGGADKAMMETAFKRDEYAGEHRAARLDDNAIDAYFILKWTLQKYGLEKTQ